MKEMVNVLDRLFLHQVLEKPVLVVRLMPP